MTGNIKFYSPKGWGFVTALESKEDVFFHIKNVHYEPIMLGDSVSFKLIKSTMKPGKMEAINVTIQS